MAAVPIVMNRSFLNSALSHSLIASRILCSFPLYLSYLKSSFTRASSFHTGYFPARSFSFTSSSPSFISFSSLSISLVTVSVSSIPEKNSMRKYWASKAFILALLSYMTDCGRSYFAASVTREFPREVISERASSYSFFALLNSLDKSSILRNWAPVIRFACLSLNVSASSATLLKYSAYSVLRVPFLHFVSERLTDGAATILCAVAYIEDCYCCFCDFAVLYILQGTLCGLRRLASDFS